MQATELEKTENYYRTQMQKDRIVERLKENGCRITKQRMVLMDIIKHQKLILKSEQLPCIGW